MRLILHSYRRCPFCIRARIILHLKGFAYEVVEEPLRKWTGWMQDWSRASGERARVPVLQYFDDDGNESIIPESNDIDYFLDALDGNPAHTLTKDSEGWYEMKKWWTWCDEEVKPAIDLYKYGKDLQWDKVSNEMYKKALQAHIQKLEDHLAGHTHLVEERLTLADIAVIPFVRQIMRTREEEFGMEQFPHVLAWANTILETEWFQNEVMKKYPLADIGPAYQEK